MWFFFSPNIIYAENALDHLENVPGEKIFVVTDKILTDLGMVKILTDKLEELGRNYEIFKDVVPDPHEEDIHKAAENCTEYGPDLIIAFGGGSVIDTAKACWAIYEFPGLKITDLYPFNQEIYKIGKKAKLIAIPTTSGTGAETTMAIVVSRFEDGVWKKYEQAHKAIIPEIAILDPRFPMGMPPGLTAATGFDGLAHSLEGLISTWKNEFSDAMSLKAVELIFEYLPIAVKDGKNAEARDLMHQAATMAGLAFGNSQAHLGHTLGHAYGAVFHTSHGNAVGCFLTYTLQYCMNNPEDNETLEILAKFAKQLGIANWDDDSKKAADILVDKVKALQREVQLPATLKELGQSKEELEENLDLLVELCFQSSISTCSPRSANGDMYRKLFRYAFEGKDVDF